jgi:excisionase family DNA binding protein
MEKFFTTEEAAAELGVTSARARQLIRAGVLKAQQFGRAYVVTAAAITEARRRHSKPGPVPKAKPAQSNGKKRGKK